jgi:tyrosyl-tRNA synthetase
VWLNADLLGHMIIGSFWRTRRMATSAGFLRRFTDLPVPEIARLQALEGAEINDAKRRWPRGDGDASWGGCGAGGGRYRSADVRGGASGEALPTLAVPGGSILLADALVGLGLSTSKKEARRLIGQGVRV